MATLLIGYDVEWGHDIVRPTAPNAMTEEFLRIAAPLHKELQAPCTIFVCGQTLENSADAFRHARDVAGDLWDFQQHTYSHVLLKTVCFRDTDGMKVVRGGTLEAIRLEARKATRALREHLGVSCTGLSGPYGYYRGLSDRPDILEILHEEGLRFTRTYARNAEDGQPVDLDLQPFWYDAQGLPDMFEFPVQGYQDLFLRGKVGWGNHQGYLDEIDATLDYVAGHDLAWGYAQHDWSSIREDPTMEITRRVIEHARARGIAVRTYHDYYQERLSHRSSQTKAVIERE
jgi:peptidoglycan/xylan/chitin deacetylase (PgdA/CDA1 family)